VVALAAATWLAASAARPVPVAVGAGVVGLAVALRRPWMLVVGCALIASTLGAWAWAGLHPVVPRTYEGTILLVSDPTDASGAVRADAKLDDGDRVEVWARGGVARTIQDALAGERMDVRGELEPPPAGATWLAVRHVVGRMSIEAVTTAPRPNDAVARFSNAFRRTLASGSYALPAEQRSLFLGFVLGDDRGQDPSVIDDFRGSGLSHLLVVSGQNVAFLLVLSRPLTRRLPMAGRTAIIMALLVWFATLTRFEPSVLRATAMAAVSTLAVHRGSRATALRCLALAVTALLLVDPLLQASVGFRLSVGASIGIIALAPVIKAAIPGPELLREALGVTLGAQAGVAPVLVGTFGGLPVASTVANLAAVPMAGPVMMWGLTAGLVAGVTGPVLGGLLSRLLHLPTRVLLWWVGGVARVGADVPAGQYTGVTTTAVAVVLGAFVWARRKHHRALARVLAVGLVVALLCPALALRSQQHMGVEVASGATLWSVRGAAVLIVTDARARPVDVLEGIRRSGIGRIDLYASASGGPSAGALVEVVRSSVEVVEVWQPVNGILTDGAVPEPGRPMNIGSLVVEPRSVDPRLTVQVHTAAPST